MATTRGARLRSSSGFSLTEVLISVIVISIGVVGFASAVGLAGTELWLGRRDTDVALLTADQLERLKAQGYDEVSSSTRTSGQYELDWTVVDGDPKKVVMVVSYPGHDGTTRADTVVSYISRR